MEDGNYEFSFSGLKSAVLNYLNAMKMKRIEIPKADVAASFQKAVVEGLVKKTIEAVETAGRDTLVLAGGVAANHALVERLQQAADERGIRFRRPSQKLCTDNAAMIACRGYYQSLNGDFADVSLNAVPGLRL